MKRAIVVGVIGFLLGAATAPRAANRNETLTLLCKRVDDAHVALYRSDQENERKTGRPISHLDRDLAIVFLQSVVCAP